MHLDPVAADFYAAAKRMRSEAAYSEDTDTFLERMMLADVYRLLGRLYEDIDYREVLGRPVRRESIENEIHETVQMIRENHGKISL